MPIRACSRLLIWLMELRESVRAARTAAEVRLVEAGFHTSSALAAVSGSCNGVRVVPGTTAVRLPLVLVVPLRARVAPLWHRAPDVTWAVRSCPSRNTAVARQLPSMRHSALRVPVQTGAVLFWYLPGPSNSFASQRIVWELPAVVPATTPGGLT